MGIHDGHRQRMKQRFVRHGLDNFDDVNVLELLLYYALPRQDTNPLAHRLLEHFGSLSAVLEATDAQLRSVEGVGENVAALLRLVPAVTKRYMLDKTPRRELIDSATAAGRYFLPRFMYEREEVLYVLFLDARKTVLDCRELSRGRLNAVEIPVRRLVEQALELRASFVILAHNHPSGVVSPSREDEQATHAIRDALALVDVELIDHIIVSGCEYSSMRECAALR